MNYSPDDLDRVEIILNSGARIEERCVYPIGAPQAPMSHRRLMTKFQSNLAPTPKAHVRVKSWIEKLQNWPESPAILDLFFAEGIVR